MTRCTSWVCVAVLLCLACSAAAFDWTLIKHDGRDYVPVEDVAKFYSFTKIDFSNDTVNLTGATLRMQGQANARELYLNGLKFILSFPIIKVDDRLLLSRMDLSKLVEPVLRPAKISAPPVRTVVLDAGHGGFDQGARGLLGNEKDFALDVVLRARDLLLKAGYNVRLTRSGDVFVPLEDRKHPLTASDGHYILPSAANRGRAKPRPAQNLFHFPTNRARLGQIHHGPHPERQCGPAEPKFLRDARRARRAY